MQKNIYGNSKHTLHIQFNRKEYAFTSNCQLFYEFDRLNTQTKEIIKNWHADHTWMCSFAINAHIHACMHDHIIYNICIMDMKALIVLSHDIVHTSCLCFKLCAPIYNKHTHVHTHTHTHTHMRMRSTQTCSLSLSHTHIHTHIHAYAHKNTDMSSQHSPQPIPCASAKSSP